MLERTARRIQLVHRSLIRSLQAVNIWLEAGADGVGFAKRSLGDGVAGNIQILQLGLNAVIDGVYFAIGSVDRFLSRKAQGILLRLRKGQVSRDQKKC